MLLVWVSGNGMMMFMPSFMKFGRLVRKCRRETREPRRPRGDLSNFRLTEGTWTKKTPTPYLSLGS